MGESDTWWVKDGSSITGLPVTLSILAFASRLCMKLRPSGSFALPEGVVSLTFMCGAVLVWIVFMASTQWVCFLHALSTSWTFLRSPIVCALWNFLRCLIAAEFSSFHVRSTIFDSHIGALSWVSWENLRASTLTLYLLSSLSIACRSLGRLLVLPDVSFHVCHRTEVCLGLFGFLLLRRISLSAMSAHMGHVSGHAHHFLAKISCKACTLHWKFGTPNPPSVTGLSTSVIVVSPHFLPAHMTLWDALAILATTELGVIRAHQVLCLVLHRKDVMRHLPFSVICLLDHLSFPPWSQLGPIFGPRQPCCPLSLLGFVVAVCPGRSGLPWGATGCAPLNVQSRHLDEGFPLLLQRQPVRMIPCLGRLSQLGRVA